MNLLKKLHEFQRQRFPLRFLTFTTLSSILSSAAVSPVEPSPVLMFLAFVSTTFFLFHIRVIDESRDMELDSSLHPERPVQQGIITLKELFYTSFLGVIFCIAIAFYAGIPSVILTFSVLAFTALAWRDFFAKRYFATRPVLYHIVNSPQMVLIQWNIYAIYTNSFAVNYLMLLQLLLVYNGIFILEIVRKVKAPSTESNDTYSSGMGTPRATNLSMAMVIGGFAIFCFMLKGLDSASWLNVLLGLVASLGAILVMVIHRRIQSVVTEKVMVTGVVVYFVLMNVFIYTSDIW